VSGLVFILAVETHLAKPTQRKLTEIALDQPEELANNQEYNTATG